MRINVEPEIRDLKRRVSAIERSLESPHQRVSALHKDLLALEAKTEDKLKERDKRFDKIEGEIDYLRGDVRGFRSDLPKIVGDAVRQANAEKPRGKS
jgi:predicted  nucleic acid-binding Zn-ribbon protein